MRALFTTALIGLIAAILAKPASSQEGEWTDLFGNDLRDWSRSGEGKTPWRITTDRTLYCEAGASEIYVPEREFADGVLKFEYRFRPTEAKTGYKAGLWARRPLAGGGCRLALGDDCGTLNATFQGSSDRLKTLEQKPGKNPAHDPGEWNEVQVRLQGRTVTFLVNDVEVASFAECETTRGLIAIEVEGSEIQFRNMHWKEGK
jgi:hypothetical protein